MALRSPQLTYLSAIIEGMTLAVAFVGALVGGVLALVGNLVATRHELTRTHRVRLYGELMPRLVTHLRRQAIKPYVEEDIDQVERAATIASRRDRKHARHVAVAARSAIAAWEPVHQEGGAQNQARFEQALGDAVTDAEDYERWLADRF